MSFVTDDDDEYINNVKTFFTVESFVVEKSSSIFLQIKDKRSRCYLYEKSKREIFLNWWKNTQWVLTHLDQKKKKKKHLYWNEDKKFKIWKHFDEDVAVRNDIFKILCKRCLLMLKHSAVESDINIAKTHLISKQCLKIAKAKNLSQLTIIKSWKKIKHFVDFLNVNYYKDYYKYFVSMNISFIECRLLQRLLQTFEKSF
jgi:hypothetical protein